LEKKNLAAYVSAWEKVEKTITACGRTSRSLYLDEQKMRSKIEIILLGRQGPNSGKKSR